MATTGVYQSVTRGDGTTMSWGSCGSTTHPAQTDLDELVVAATCSTDLSTGSGTTTVVFAPRGRGSSWTPGRTTPAHLELVDGFGWTTEVAARTS